MDTEQADPDLRAYKYRLDPNADQLRALSQAAGAARVSYNMLIARNLDALKAGWAAERELIKAGIDAAEAKKQIRARRKQEPALQTLPWTRFSTEVLTPVRAEHRRAETVLNNGGSWDHPRWSNPWLHTAPRRVLISGAQNASRAFSNWMGSLSGARKGRPVGLPRLKKKGRDRDSFTIPVPEAMGGYGATYPRGGPRSGEVIRDYRHLRLAFLGVIRTCQNTRRLSRALKQGGRIKSFTISQAGGSWYASLLVETPAATTPPQPTRAAQARGEIGVDLGVHVMAATSDGQLVDNPAPGKKAAVRLKKLQRRLARSQKGSARRKRLVTQISRTHHKVALQRETAAHEMTKRLATGYSMVAIEDLNVAGMTASAAGTIEAPGKNIRAKSGLNRAVLDVAPGMIRRQLEYKASWHGARVEVIDRYAPSSKTCSNCGAVKSKLSLSERVYRCRQCGVVLDRDINAAINILALARGHKTETGRNHQLACGKRERVNGRGAYRLSQRARWELPGDRHGNIKTVPAGAATVPEQSDTHPYKQLQENESGSG